MGLFRRHGVHGRDYKKPGFWVIYALSVIFTFHGLLVAYSNSTYLEQYIPPEAVGALYTIGSAIAVLAFLFISRVLRKVGNVQLTLILAGIEILSLLAIGLASSSAMVLVASVLFLIINPLIFLNIDIFSESLIGKNESSTGSKRGLALALMSIASVLAPLAMGFIVGTDDGNLNKTYLYAAGVFCTFVLLTIVAFRKFEDPKYHELKVLKALHSFWVKPDLRNVFLAHFTLQIFFTWMVIYFPLYLATEIGLSWDIIGSIIAVGLVAYVLFEYPIGLIADKYLGEREMMAVGFIILATSSGFITVFASATTLGWMMLMFVSRMGASLVEVTTESYFFKHTNGTDANIMSFFRLTRPLSGVIGALLGSATLLFLPFNVVFAVLGLCMLPGVYFTLQLKDTK